MREDNLILYAFQKLAAAVIRRAYEDAYGKKKCVYVSPHDRADALNFLKSSWAENLATLCRYEEELKKN